MKTTYRILFIVNPFSGKTKKQNFPELVDRIFKGTSHEVEIVFTEYAGHAIEISKKASSDGIDIVVKILLRQDFRGNA